MVLPLRVNRAVHLDAEICRGAIEIENVGTERVLATKVQTEPVATQQRPECLFRLRQVST